MFSHHTILRTSKPLLSEANVSLLLLNIVTCPLLSQNCLSVQLKAFWHVPFISINWPQLHLIITMNSNHIIFAVIHHLYWMQRIQNRQQNVDLKQADVVQKWPQEKVEQQMMMELHKIGYCYFQRGKTKKNEKRILGINAPKAVSL